MHIPSLYLAYSLHIPWTYLGRTLDVRTISDEIVRYKSSFLRFASPLLSPCYPLTTPLLSTYFNLPITLSGYTIHVVYIYLAYSLPLSTFFLPSFFLLPTHYFVFTKGIFSVVIVRYESSMSQELSIFNSQLPIVNCQLLIVNFSFTF